ncbi:hypothetical protein WG926_12155 [Tistrella sp. BH-R2-4]|jgi:hypothetical protein|uniref:EF-hand domain-containing protein n=1 Tax=Tistrella arctica TaxID=3133430 RepID=A0ABU9YJT4_9PROT
MITSTRLRLAAALLSGGCLLIGTAGAAIAAEPPSFQSIDTDGNGALSRAEWGKMVSDQIANAEGRAAKRLAEMPEDKRTETLDRRFRGLDGDSDGSLSQAEWDARRRD